MARKRTRREGGEMEAMDKKCRQRRRKQDTEG